MLSFFESTYVNEGETEIQAPTKEGETIPVDVTNTSTTPDQVKVDININSKNIEDTQTKQEELLADIDSNRSKDRITYMHNVLTQEYAIIDRRMGMEGFSAFLRNILTSISNSVQHIMYLFRTAIFSGWKDFKRSEMMVYCDNYASTLKRVLACDLPTYVDMELDTPKGFKGSYLRGMTLISEACKDIDMLQRANKMEVLIKKISNIVIYGENTFNAIIDSANRDFANTKNVDIAFNKTEQAFTTSSSAKATFRELYGTMEGLADTIDTMKEMEKDFQDVSLVAARLESIESIVAGFIDHPNIAKLSKENLTTLGDIIKSMGFVFEKYSILMNDLFRINHNIALNLKQMAKFKNF